MLQDVQDKENVADCVSDTEEKSFFLDVELLQNFDISEADIKILKSSGIYTIKGIQMMRKKELCSLHGFSAVKVDKILQACTQLIPDSLVTALNMCEYRKNIFHITTGSQELDKLLGGGIESMAITEVYGEFCTGKTQLSHTLCVTAQIPNKSLFSGGKVVFLDTEHTFRPERLQAIAERFDLDQSAVLDNVLCARAYTTDHQFKLLDLVSSKFHEEPGVFKLLIVDSVIALFRVDYIGRGELVDRQQKLNRMMSQLQKISEQYNICVFITNQVTADPGSGLSLLTPNLEKPVGGNIVAHASTTRISLRKGRGHTRIAKICDSPNLPENEGVFEISLGGITDVQNNKENFEL